MFEAYDAAQFTDKNSIDTCYVCRVRPPAWMRKNRAGKYLRYCPLCRRDYIVNTLSSLRQRVFGILVKFPGYDPVQVQAKLFQHTPLIDIQNSLAELRSAGVLDQSNRPLSLQPTEPIRAKVEKKPDFWRLFLLVESSSRPLDGQYSTRKAAVNAAKRLRESGRYDSDSIAVGQEDITEILYRPRKYPPRKKGAKHAS